MQRSAVMQHLRWLLLLLLLKLLLQPACGLQHLVDGGPCKSRLLLLGLEQGLQLRLDRVPTGLLQPTAAAGATGVWHEVLQQRQHGQ
jgi:hypothetical protein